MRIGIYNPRVGFSRAGGTETFLREMMRRLQDNYEIHLYCGEDELLKEVQDLDIEITTIPVWKKESRRNELLAENTPLLPAEVESISMYWHARRHGVFDRLSNEVDVLSTHYYLDNLLVSRSTPVPTLFRFPGIKHPSVRWRTMAKFASPNCYLSNSQATAERLREWLDLDVDGTVYAGVDLDQFSPDTDPAFTSDRVSILFVGRLDDGKGLNDLLDAYARITDEAALYLVGSGVLEDDLRTRARELGIKDSVTFVGAVAHNEIQRYYAAADVFCLPSYHEGFPVVNMEALASGCALVTTRLDAIEEQVTDGEQALLFEPGDVDGLVDALGRAVRDEGLRDRLAENGLERSKAFGWDEQAKQMREFYEHVGQQ
jgi:glycosyltransferase involved in cell wall biosynthesis